MKTHFLADPHLEHEGVLQMSNRLFDTIEEHNDHIVEVTNLKVGEDDRLFVLGDFGWHSEASWFAKLRCKNIHLIVGNHDRGRAIRLFKTVNDVAEIKIGDDYIFLSHYPNAYWPGSHKGYYHLYGHCHFQREDTLNSLFPGRRSMDVGVDSCFQMFGYYGPLEWSEIKEVLGERPGHDDIEFYKQRQRQVSRWISGRVRERLIDEMKAKVRAMRAA